MISFIKTKANKKEKGVKKGVKSNFDSCKEKPIVKLRLAPFAIGDYQP